MSLPTDAKCESFWAEIRVFFKKSLSTLTLVVNEHFNPHKSNLAPFLRIFISNMFSKAAMVELSYEIPGLY